MKILISLIFVLHLVYAFDRIYFIAAEEIEWDYAPSNKDVFTGMKFNETNYDDEMEDMNPSLWTIPSSNRIGKEYKKVVYREYTNANFTTLKTRNEDWKHLGLLGPVIKAVVGDTIKITFKNNWNRPLSMHPHGVLYDKDNEGVPQFDEHSNGNLPTPTGDPHGHQMIDSTTTPTMNRKNGNSVTPGSEWTYKWDVPERSGPTENDPSSILWIYHSHVDEIRDVNIGLIGPIIISRKGSVSGSETRPTNVDREFVIMTSIIDENMSWLLEKNMEKLVMRNNSMQPNVTTSPTQPTNSSISHEMMMMMMMMENAEFKESNMKHVVNGFLYSNLQGLRMFIGERVRWYLFAVGDERDLHGVHWHGQTLTYDGHRVDVMEVIPASMRTLDMIPDNPGRWLLHCHTNHHIAAGMSAFFDVFNNTQLSTNTDHGNSLEHDLHSASDDSHENGLAEWAIALIILAVVLVLAVLIGFFMKRQIGKSQNATAIQA